MQVLKIYKFFKIKIFEFLIQEKNELTVLKASYKSEKISGFLFL